MCRTLQYSLANSILVNDEIQRGISDQFELERKLREQQALFMALALP